MANKPYGSLLIMPVLSNEELKKEIFTSTDISLYKKVDTTFSIKLSGNENLIYPLATLCDDSGGMCQIINDDHCYVLCLKKEDGTYVTTPHIFKEAFNLLRQLPELV